MIGTPCKISYHLGRNWGQASLRSAAEVSAMGIDVMDNAKIFLESIECHHPIDCRGGIVEGSSIQENFVALARPPVILMELSMFE